jgi:hypothetical protein
MAFPLSGSSASQLGHACSVFRHRLWMQRGIHGDSGPQMGLEMRLHECGEERDMVAA